MNVRCYLFACRTFEKAQEAYEKTKHQLNELEQAERKRKAELIRLNDRKKKLSDEIAKEEKKVTFLRFCLRVPLKTLTKDQ